MNKIDVMKRRSLLVIAILCAIMIGWHYLPYLFPVSVPGFMNHRIRLRNGYEIVTEDDTLVKGSHPLIMPVIDGYRVHGGLVVGHVKKLDSMSKPGYFVLDTKTGKKWQGLSEDEWMKVLGKYGITNVPPLVEPRGFSGFWARF